MSNEHSSGTDRMTAGLIAAPSHAEVASAPRATFSIDCVGPDGGVKWTEHVHNTVMTAGKVDMLNVYFGATAKPAAWYLVLKQSGTESAADTLASHATWTEATGVYTSANRPTVAFGTAAANGANGQISTSSAVSVAITASGTITGCGLCQTQVKATTTGVLYNAGDFTASRTVASGDTMNITITINQN